MKTAIYQLKYIVSIIITLHLYYEFTILILFLFLAYVSLINFDLGQKRFESHLNN